MRAFFYYLLLLALLGCAETRQLRQFPVSGMEEPLGRLDFHDIPQLIADAYWHMSAQRWRPAAYIAKEIINHQDDLGRLGSPHTADAYVILAKSYCQSGEYAPCVTSMSMLDQILRLPAIKNTYGAYRLIERLGELYESIGHIERAKNGYDEAFDLAKTQNNKSHIDVRRLAFTHNKEPMDLAGTRLLIDDLERELSRCDFRSDVHDCYWNSHGVGHDRRGLLQALNNLYLKVPQYFLKRTATIDTKSQFAEYIASLERKADRASSSERPSLHCLIARIYLDRRDISEAKVSFRRCRQTSHDFLDRVYHNGSSTKVDIANIRKMANEFDSAINYELSVISLSEGKLTEAKNLMALSITKALPEIDPLYIEFGHYMRVRDRTNRLAQIYWLNRNEGLARTAWNDATDIAEEQFRRLGRFETETVLLGHIGALREISHTIINTLYLEPDTNRRARLADLALASTLLSQARVADALNEQLAPFSGPRSQQEQDLIRNQRSLRFRMTALESQVSDSERGRQVRLELAGLRHSLELLDAQLREHTGHAPIQLPLSRQIVGAVAKRLPRDSALIDYVHLRLRDPRIPEGQQKEQYRYLALVLRSDATVTALDLGDAQGIDRIVRDLHEDLAHARPDYEARTRAAYDRLIRPLLPVLTDVERLFLVPDADLHLLPFSVLSDGNESLRSHYQISYLSSGRDLLRSSKRVGSGNVVVFANPDVRARANRDGPGLMASNTEPQPRPDDVADIERTRGLHLRRSPTRSASQSVRELADLPGADAEAQAIAQLLPLSTIHRREQASESELFAIRPAPTVLHFATHGLFFDSRDEASGGLLQQRGPRIDPEGAEPNPLLRSALVLAGAAHGRLHPESPYDGLATALEISSGLALQGTKLVVLSACETARGVVMQGEGVAGLRRAFLVAGAESVIASLWKVDDSVTRLLMTHFYRLLRAGRSRSEALTTSASVVRSKPEYAHPYYWAGFVLVGQDGPIENLKE